MQPFHPSASSAMNSIFVSLPPDHLDQSDRPSTGASNDPPEHVAHVRSRSTAYASSPKRLSVFSGRSRSNTTSTASSSRSPASSMTSIDIWAIQDDRNPPQAVKRPERPESVSKSIFSRGSRILRRQGSKFSISDTLDEEDESERDKPRSEASSVSFSRSHKSRQSNRSDQLKSIISEPFNFHHLTHTNPAHFESIDTTRENDLVTEFSAIRASQRAGTELKGIRAEDLHFRYYSHEELSCAPGTPSEEPVSVAISTPDISPRPSFSSSPQRQNRKSKRESRAFENFSRPVPRYSRIGATTPPMDSSRLPAPPMQYSERTPRAIDEVLDLPLQQPYSEHGDTTLKHTQNVGSFSQLNFADIFGREGRPLSVHNREVEARGSSMSLSSYPLDLEDVPEEEECTKWHDSPEPKAGRSSRASSRLDELLPGASPFNRALPRSELSINVSADLSKKFSEVLGSPTLPQYPPGTPRKILEGEGHRTRSRANTAAAETADSWDADIDYCYEHAAEANFDFDWSRDSLEEPGRSEHMAPIITSDGNLQERQNQPLNQICLSSSALPKLDLDPSPALSSNSHVVAAPSVSKYEGDLMAHEGGDYFHPVSSSVFPSTVGKQTTQDALYEDFLAADAESDRHFSFSSQGAVQPMDHSLSPRSSFSPISKCNSQESLMISRAASIARKHRSSISSNSVPDLVHSLSASRESVPADQPPTSEQATRAAAAYGRRGSANPRRPVRELESPILWRDSNSSLEHAVLANAATTHDGPKSPPEVEGSLPFQAIKTDSPYAAGAHRALNQKKSRTSYSLFPAPGTAL